MRDCAALWRARAREIAERARAFAGNQPGASHRLRDALRQIGATASLLGERALSRRARRLAGRLKRREGLESERALLARARELNLLSPEASAGLDAGWERRAARADRAATRVTEKSLRRLQRRMSDLARRGNEPGGSRLEDARERARESVVSPPPVSAGAGEIRRYRRAVRASLDRSDDLQQAEGASADPRVRRERQVLEVLDRWSGVRRFRRSLAKSRRKAERQGAVTLVSELDVFLAILERTEKDVRRRALESARNLSNVIPLPERTAAGE
jgi:hypothetical protein